jgi:hypothetical protein
MHSSCHDVLTDLLLYQRVPDPGFLVEVIGRYFRFLCVPDPGFLVVSVCWGKFVLFCHSDSVEDSVTSPTF